MWTTIKFWFKWLKPQGFWLHIWVLTPILRGFLRFTVKYGIFNIVVNGRENVPKKGPVIATSNHLSYADPVPLWGALRRPAVAMAAAELWRHPLIGPILFSMRHIPVDRKSRESGTKAKEKCKKHLRRGGLIFMYFEGKRSKSGKLLPPKRGIYELASETGAAVVPVGVIGTNDLLSYDNKHFNRKALVTQNFGEPMYTKDFGSETEFLTELRLRVQELSGQDLAEE